MTINSPKKEMAYRIHSDPTKWQEIGKLGLGENEGRNSKV